MTGVEKLQISQQGKCAGCGSYGMTTEDQGGMKCHKCDRLYCSKCYRITHAQHNIEWWNN